ncbi:MAG: hypothetical protein ABL893_00915 [Hyphomicrobium sp.]
MSAAISWTLIPIAVADAPSTPAAEQSSGLGMDNAVKQLHSVPEDGMGDKGWLSGATRVVRELLAKRPKEDLIICVAGCVEKQDRVVYAQPADALAPKPAAAVSDAAPAAAPAPQAQAEKPAAVEPAKEPVKMTAPVAPVDAKPAAVPVAATPAATPAVKGKAPEEASASQPALAPAARATTANEPAVPQFMPSSAAPKSGAAPQAEGDKSGADAGSAAKSEDEDRKPRTIRKD